MFKISKYVSVFLFIALLVCCQSQAASPEQGAANRLNSLLYSGFNDQIQEVIWQLDVETGTRRLWRENQGISHPSRSPDGARVAYFVDEGTKGHSLWVADADGRNDMQLGGPYPFRQGRVMAEWSFDSQYVAVRTSHADRSMPIKVLDATTGQVVNTVQGWDFAWSPVSNQMAVLASRLRLLEMPSGTEQWRLEVSSHNRGMDWTTDGKGIVFSSGQRAHLYSVYIVDTDGRNLRELTNDTEQYSSRSLGGIQVSPDGEHLLFGSNFRTQDGVESIAALMLWNLNTGQVRQLASGLSGPSTWSPDGKHIVFGSTQDAAGNRVGQSWELFKISLDDDVIVQLTDDSAAPVGLTW